METNDISQQPQEEIKLPVFKKLILIFTNPSDVFKNLSVYPSWIFPTILILILSICGGYLMKDLQIAAQKEMIVKSEKLPEDQKSIILEGMEQRANSPFQLVMMFGGIIVYIFATFAIAAAIFLFTGNTILGGSASYKSMLTVYAWGYLVAIPEMIIKIPLALMKNSIHVYTSLAILFDPSESKTALFKIANAIDLFSLWRVALWAIGFSIVYKFSKEKSSIAIASLYIIWVAISIGLSSLFGGLLGM